MQSRINKRTSIHHFSNRSSISSLSTENFDFDLNTDIYNSPHVYSIIDSPFLSKRNSNLSMNLRNSRISTSTLSTLAAVPTLEEIKSPLNQSPLPIPDRVNTLNDELNLALDHSQIDLTINGQANPPSLDLLIPSASIEIPNNEPKTPLDQMIPNALESKNLDRTFTSDDTPAEQNSPESCTYNYSYENVLKPRVSLNPHFGDSDDITCLLSVKSPHIDNQLPINPHDEFLKSKVVSIFVSRLIQANNWSSCIGLNALGDLLLIDVLQVSTTEGVHWDPLQCFCFTNGLIVYDNLSNSLIGQVIYKQDFKNLIFDENKIIIEFNNTDTIPELQLMSEIGLLSDKWKYYLTKLLKQHLHFSIPLFQLTTTCWDSIIENLEVKLPTELVKFSESFHNNPNCIPTSLALLATPKPDKLPLTLIVSICLVNHDNELSNNEYKSLITQMVNKIRSTMNQYDKLGLIFVGNSDKNSSFTGCIESNWIGWDKILDSLSISSNKKINFKPFLKNGLEEILITFNKFRHLNDFIPNESNSNCQLLVLQNNNYNANNILNDFEEFLNFQKMGQRILKGNNNLTILNQLSDMIEFFQESSSLSSINIVRIGKKYNQESLIMQKILSNPIFNNLNSKVTVSFGHKLLRYDTLSNFVNEDLVPMVEKFQQITIPKITVDLNVIHQNNLKVDEVEINGGTYSLSNLQIENIQIILNDININYDRDIYLKLKFPMDSNSKFTEIPMITYQTQWLNQLDDLKTMSSNLSQVYAAATSSTFIDFESLTPFNLGSEDPFYNDNPLLPPLSPSKDQNLTKKLLEIAMMHSLSRIDEHSLSEDNKSIICSTIQKIIDSTRGLNIDSESDLMSSTIPSYYNFNHIHDNREYVQHLLHKLSILEKLFDETPELAVVKSRDFTNLLM